MNTIKRITIEHLYDKIDAAATKAAPLFRLYGWTYSMVDSSDNIPTHNDLVDSITRLTESALEYFYESEEEYRKATVGSGRFSVSVKEFEEEVDVKIVLELGGHTWLKASKES